MMFHFPVVLLQVWAAAISFRCSLGLFLFMEAAASNAGGPFALRVCGVYANCKGGGGCSPVHIVCGLIVRPQE